MYTYLYILWLHLCATYIYYLYFWLLKAIKNQKTKKKNIKPPLEPKKLGSNASSKSWEKCDEYFFKN